MYVWFIAYLAFDSNGATSCGNTDLMTGERVKSISDIRKMESAIRQDIGANRVVIVNYRLLGDIDLRVEENNDENINENEGR